MVPETEQPDSHARPGTGVSVRSARLRPMRTDEFWAIVDGARAGADGDLDLVARRITDELAGREPAEIVAFHRHLHKVFAASYRVDLWGAAYLINGGASDDGFEYFRCWLMTQGRVVFARAVTDPDSLAELPAVRRAAMTGEEFDGEPMRYVAANAYRQATGNDLPADLDLAPYPKLDEFWDFDDEESARIKLPKLAALFVEPPAE